MSGIEATPEVVDLRAVPAQVTVTESPTVAVARERLVEAIGREAAFLADQRAGQASGGLEALARAFALVTAGPIATTAAATATPAITTRGLRPVDQNEIGQRETVEINQR